MTVSEALNSAVRLQQAGDLPRAERLYRQVLSINASQPDAWHLLGVILYQTGRKHSGLEHIREAIRLKPEFAEAYFNYGNMLRDSGELQQAVEAYRQCVQLRPDNAEAHYNLANTLNDLEQREAAVESFRQAVRCRPEYVKALNNLGDTLLKLNRTAEAVEAFERAVKINPDYAVGYCNLGNALRQLGRLDEAVVAYRRALDLRPSDSVMSKRLRIGLNITGLAYAVQGKLDKAVDCYGEALELWPDFAEAHNNLGNALKDQGKQQEAIACFRRALELNPDYAEAHNNLGIALAALGKLDSAIACYRKAMELKPEYPEIHSNLGNTLKAQGRISEALACYRRAVELNPNCAAPYNNLGIALQEQGKLEEAVASFRRGLEFEPNRAELHNNLGNAIRDKDEAIQCYRRALELKPSFAEAHSNLLCSLQYQTDTTLADLAAAHAEFEQRHGSSRQGSRPQHNNDPDPYRRLRVGFVSPDLGRHPVGDFVVGVLENVDRKACETFCYSDRLVKDERTARIRTAVTTWRDVFGWNDESLADQVRADRIDILFDLAGHTARNRLLTFVRKPAPVQITWMGYVGTTGLKAIDYILADRYEIPEKAERHYIEKVLRLPEGYVCYDPPAYAPPIVPPPVFRQGHVTFGSFNNPSKIAPQVIEVWAKILRSVPESRLVLKYRWMADPVMSGRMQDEFARREIDPQRIECLGRSPHAELLAEYNRIDVALDPFPYNGGLTTCEALWMGVPVITCPGETFASRHSLSHLSNVGLTETIAGSLDEYVELAVALTNDTSRLAAIRGSLRDQMARSPLCDGKRFATNLMRVLREAWQTWCREAKR